MRTGTSRPDRRQRTSYFVVIALLLLLAGCGPAQELVPVKGRLTTLMAEGPPSGYIGTFPGSLDGSITDEYRGKRDPFTVQDQSVLTAGQHIYYAAASFLSCVFCHGGQGRGYGPRAFYMDILPADYAAPPMLSAFRDHQDYVLWWVSEGIPKSVMPAFKDVLSEAELWQVITYAWYLGERGAPPQIGPAGSASDDGGASGLVVGDRDGGS